LEDAHEKKGKVGINAEKRGDGSRVLIEFKLEGKNLCPRAAAKGTKELVGGGRGKGFRPIVLVKGKRGAPIAVIERLLTREAVDKFEPYMQGEKSSLFEGC